MIRRILAPVIDNAPLKAPDHYVLRFHAPELVADVRPGQFVTILGETGAQILRRPFSIFTADEETGEATVLYRAKGPTSQWMGQRKPGDIVDLLGPLGKRVFAPDTRPGAHHIMVGGGYGVPPLVFLMKSLLDADPQTRVTFINGARTEEFLVGTERVEALGGRLFLCTDDGSCGVRGRVTDVLAELLGDKSQPHHVYTCGPTPMMQAVAEMSIALDVPCQVSMEVFMPCGLGICMGCAVQRPDGSYARGCYEGPVFPAHEVVW